MQIDLEKIIRMRDESERRRGEHLERSIQIAANGPARGWVLSRRRPEVVEGLAPAWTIRREAQ